MHEARRRARAIAARLLDNFLEVGAVGHHVDGASVERLARAVRDLRDFLDGLPSRKRRRRARPAGSVPLPLDPDDARR